mmetsp:Transcript_91401/g.258398  ORF Transcript_91401/g.258398 Transcript_91401/m.258398 type:complete len:293 (+) Transcript_91401:510-1388(+)
MVVGRAPRRASGAGPGPAGLPGGAAGGGAAVLLQLLLGRAQDGVHGPERPRHAGLPLAPLHGGHEALEPDAGLPRREGAASGRVQRDHHGHPARRQLHSLAALDDSAARAVQSGGLRFLALRGQLGHAQAHARHAPGLRLPGVLHRLEGGDLCRPPGGQLRGDRRALRRGPDRPEARGGGADVPRAPAGRRGLLGPRQQDHQRLLAPWLLLRAGGGALPRGVRRGAPLPRHAHRWAADVRQVHRGVRQGHGVHADGGIVQGRVDEADVPHSRKVCRQSASYTSRGVLGRLAS